MTGKRALVCVASAVVVLFAAAASAPAGFIFTSQNRSVYGATYGALGSASQTITAPDFGLFDETVSVSHPQYGGGAIQRQRSELLENSISVLGSSSVSRPGMVGTGIAETRSWFDVWFSVDATTPVTLSAEVSLAGTDPASGGPGEVRLTGPGTNIGWSYSRWPGSSSTTTNLAPGTYQMVVNFGSNNSAQGSAIVSNFNARLSEVPEPGLVGVGGAVLATLAALLPGSRARRRR